MNIALKGLLLGVIGAALIASASAAIVVNEFEVNPPEGSPEWVEIYNTGNSTVDVGGWSVVITDGGWKGMIDLPMGAIIAPGGFYVATGNPTWHHDDGGYVTLYSADGTKVDETSYRRDFLDNDFTIGRHPDGHDTNTDGDWGQMYASRGRPNVI